MLRDVNVARRELLLASLAAAPLLIGSSGFGLGPAFTPEQFGARGDGRTNDTLAFARLSDAVQRAGGGTIRLSRRTYRVGWQRELGAANYRLSPSPILEFKDLPGGLRIEGNGATLRCAPGLRFGSFEGEELRPWEGIMPLYDLSVRATPYETMIRVDRSRGPVEITGLELDGAIHQAVIGGSWGDVGRQIAMTGVVLRDNAGPELVADVLSHRHGQDGMMIDGITSSDRPSRRVERVRCLENGRQGCSIVGGQGYVFADCEFSRTGRLSVSSPPGAGVDIEAEGKKVIADLHFSNCRMADNSGCGVVADSGPSSDVRFIDCALVGTTSWSNWCDKPRFSYEGCTFVGAAVHPFASKDAADATRFFRCTFTDDPARGRVATVYLQNPAGSTIMDAGGSFGSGRNVLFDNCSVECVGEGLLPWTVDSIYRSCRMRQRSIQTSYPRGVYRGTNRIDGTAVLDGSRIEGSLLLNGQAFA